MPVRAERDVATAFGEKAEPEMDVGWYAHAAVMQLDLRHLAQNQPLSPLTEAQGLGYTRTLKNELKKNVNIRVPP